MSYEDPRTIKDPVRARAHLSVGRAQKLLPSLGAPMHEIKQAGLRSNLADEPHVCLGSLCLDIMEAFLDAAERAES